MSSPTRRFTVSARKPAVGESPGQLLELGTAVEWEGKKLSIDLITLPMDCWWSGVLLLQNADAPKGGDRQILRRFNLVAPKRGPAPEKKTKWVAIGVGYEWTDGTITVEFETRPAGNWWDGKLHLFEQKPKKDASK